MFEYKRYFAMYCKEENLDLHLSFEMPSGYENANGTFDVKTKTVYINAMNLCKNPDYEKLFFLFHELRHALQYLFSEKFSAIIRRSISYIIMYDGACYKWDDGKYQVYKLEGEEDFLINLYLGQPHEVDANTFAYEQTKKICGDSEELRKLYEFWIPHQSIPDEIYDSVYTLIDERVK